MAYRYINPGHGNLFPNKSQTSYQTQTGSQYTRTGASFGNCGGCNLPTPPAGMKEVWAKFDCRVCATSGYYNIGIYSQNKNCKLGENNSWGRNAYCVINGTKKEDIAPSADMLCYYWLHIKSGVVDGLYEVYERGQLKYSFEGNVLNGEDIISIGFYSTGNERCFSNIIVSDTEIAKTENVITLPISATDATMTDNGDGSYSASSVGEYAKQTIDAATLKQTYDASKTRITGVMAAGRPAYYDGEGLTKMDCLKSDVAVGESELATNNAYSIMYGETLNTITIDELAANTYGWRAK